MSSQSRRASIYTFPDVISPEECGVLIELGESAGFSPAPIEGPLDGPFDFLVRGRRDNSRSAIDDVPLSSALWRRIARHMPADLDGHSAVGLNERLRFYRYDTGQGFGAHTDGYYLRANGERSLLTLMLYLNDDYEGGETYFYESGEVVAPRAGKVLVFPHGLWHAGRTVTAGRKYVLRTDVMYAPAARAILR